MFYTEASHDYKPTLINVPLQPPQLLRLRSHWPRVQMSSMLGCHPKRQKIPHRHYRCFRLSNTIFIVKYISLFQLLPLTNNRVLETCHTPNPHTTICGQKVTFHRDTTPYSLITSGKGAFTTKHHYSNKQVFQNINSKYCHN